jgi:outer membrane murein-binding lipoprotein Lpp
MDRRTIMNKPLISIALGALLLAGTASRAHADNDYSRAEQRADRQDAREDTRREIRDDRQELRRDQKN